MRLRIKHKTSYRFDEPVHYGLQQLRTTPKNNHQQTVLNWSTTIEGGRREVTFTDHHNNFVELISFDRDVTEVIVRSEGEVEVKDTSGVLGRQGGMTPLWLFARPTSLTKHGAGTRALVRQVEGTTDIERLHALSAVIGGSISYRTGTSHSGSTAEEAIAAGQGVCQDHAHVFITCAREMGYPARYVSGYLMMDDRIEQDATHAWAEAHVDGLGWVGFDVSNAQSPDDRYVRVATGLDYSGAAPVIGSRFGGEGEHLDVQIEVAQQ